MWCFHSRPRQASSRRRPAAPVLSLGGQVENLEERALLSASGFEHGGSAHVASVADGKAAVPKIQIIDGTYDIHSSSGNTGTYAFVQTGLDVAVTAKTTHYTGTATVHFNSEHSHKAKGGGQYLFNGESSSQPILLKMKFKVVNGDLDFSYKYHTLRIS